MEDEDIYGDLTAEESKESQTIVNNTEQFVKHIQSLNADIAKLCQEMLNMKKREDGLKKNISELFKTAKCEIERKDRIIAELRKELDDLKFRRHHNNRANAKNTKPVEIIDEPPPDSMNKRLLEIANSQNDSKPKEHSPFRSKRSPSRESAQNVKRKRSRSRTRSRSRPREHHSKSRRYDHRYRRSKSRSPEDRSRRNDRHRGGSYHRQRSRSRHRNTDRYGRDRRPSEAKNVKLEFSEEPTHLSKERYTRTTIDESDVHMKQEILSYLKESPKKFENLSQESIAAVDSELKKENHSFSSETMQNGVDHTEIAASKEESQNIDVKYTKIEEMELDFCSKPNVIIENNQSILKDEVEKSSMEKSSEHNSSKEPENVEVFKQERKSVTPKPEDQKKPMLENSSAFKGRLSQKLDIMIKNMDSNLPVPGNGRISDYLINKLNSSQHISSTSSPAHSGQSDGLPFISTELFPSIGKLPTLEELQNVEHSKPNDNSSPCNNSLEEVRIKREETNKANLDQNDKLKASKEMKMKIIKFSKKNQLALKNSKGPSSNNATGVPVTLHISNRIVAASKKKKTVVKNLEETFSREASGFDDVDLDSAKPKNDVKSKMVDLFGSDSCEDSSFD